MYLSVFFRTFRPSRSTFLCWHRGTLGLNCYGHNGENYDINKSVNKSIVSEKRNLVINNQSIYQSIYFKTHETGAAGFGPNHYSKWGARLSPLPGSNNGNPTLGIEPEFTYIKRITTDLYIIDN